MIITEEQAKSKWCPMARVHSKTNTSSYNKYPDSDTELPSVPVPDQARCIASDCMMWRWHPDYRQDGYCGLAEVPK